MQTKIVDFYIDKPELKDEGCSEVDSLLRQGYFVQGSHLFSDHGRARLVFILQRHENASVVDDSLYEEENQIAQEFTVGQMDVSENPNDGAFKFEQIKGILGMGSKLP